MPDDPPPADYDVPTDFKFDYALVQQIATTLAVNTKYVIQAYYYVSLSDQSREITQDEIMAHVLENHPRVSRTS